MSTDVKSDMVCEEATKEEMREMGLALVNRSNNIRMLGKDDEIALKLLTTGREMVKKSREMEEDELYEFSERETLFEMTD